MAPSNCGDTKLNPEREKEMIKDKNPDLTINIEEIISLIPHRYPMLLVDRVLSYVPGKHIVALKNVTINEPYFVGHFPGKPVMPGVLIIEAMAQSSAILVVKTMGQEMHGKIVYFMSINEAKFRRPVTPGDTLHFHISTLQGHGSVWKMKCEARVDDIKVAEAIVTAKIMGK
jgi:3-hydroxyacyl-[acyl-carrier-protein] dehydratase